MQQKKPGKAVEGVVFADITGSTTLFEKLGDAEAHAIVTKVLDALEKLAEEKGGRTLKKIGDEVLCVFPDADGAVQFGCSAQRQLAIHAGGRRIELRIGVNYGPVVHDALGDVFGDTVNVAARLRALASPGQVITTQDTLDAVVQDARLSTRRLGSHALVGKNERVQVVEVLWEEQQLGNLTQMPRGPLPELQVGPLVLRLFFHGEPCGAEKPGQPAGHSPGSRSLEPNGRVERFGLPTSRHRMLCETASSICGTTARTVPTFAPTETSPSWCAARPCRFTVAGISPSGWIFRRGARMRSVTR